MNTTANISIRVPRKDALLLKRAAKYGALKLAAFVRDAAVEKAVAILTAAGKLDSEKPAP